MEIHGERKVKELNGKDIDKIKAEQNKPFQWEKVIQKVMEEMNMHWDEVLRLNVYKFNHFVKFITHKEQEKATILKQQSNAKRVRRF